MYACQSKKCVRVDHLQGIHMCDGKKLLTNPADPAFLRAQFMLFRVRWAFVHYAIFKEGDFLLLAKFALGQGVGGAGGVGFCPSCKIYGRDFVSSFAKLSRGWGVGNLPVSQLHNKFPLMYFRS